MECIVNSETFLSLHIQEYSPLSIRKSLKCSYRTLSSPKHRLIGVKLRSCSSVASYTSFMSSSSSNYDFSQYFIQNKNSLTKNSLSNISVSSMRASLSLDVRTLKNLKKIETKKYHNLIAKVIFSETSLTVSYLMYTTLFYHIYLLWAYIVMTGITPHNS